VHDSPVVRRFERLENLPGNGQGFVNRHGPLLDAISDRRPFDHFHDERLDALSLLETVHVRDIRMIQGGEDLRFALKPSEAVCVRGKGIRQHFQGVFALERRVPRAPDLTHPAAAERSADLVRAEAGAGGQRH
jgi:hypothetical protein